MSGYTGPLLQVGGIYHVQDDLLRLPPESKRNLHVERRMFVLISNEETLRDTGWALVLGCPLSSQSSWKTPYDVKLAKGEGNVSKKCWVRLP